MRRPARALLIVIAAFRTCTGQVQVVVPPTVGVPGGAEIVPSPAHDLAIRALAEGEYSAAVELATKDHQGGVRVGGQRWIDAIASSAVLGECCLELGLLADATARYDESMLAFAANGDWLLALQFRQDLRPRPGGRVATWGRSGRRSEPGLVPETVAIRQKAADPQQVLQRGGVLAADFDRPVRPQELVRMLVIAVYRQRVVLGDLAADTAGLAALGRAVARHPAPQHPLSAAWLDVLRGAASWAQGKPDQAAASLGRGLVAGGRFDHGLTCWGLIIMGRIAMDADQPQQAASHFEEAALAAAECGDLRAVEEAFTLAAAAHATTGARGLPRTLRAGAAWARSVCPVARARLLAVEAQLLAAAGDPRGAAAVLGDVDGRLLRGDAGRSMAGAEVSYAKACTAYAAGDVAGGDARLDEALAIARPRTPRIFQATRLVEQATAGTGGLSDRKAEAAWVRLLADPSPRDVAADPLGSLAMLTTPLAAGFDAWVAVAARRGVDPAVEALEATARHRWMAARPLGGRRVAVERLIAADPRSLEPESAARRASLLGDRPELSAAVEGMARLGGPLAAAVAAGAPADAAGDAAVAGGEYVALAAARARIVASIAAGREAVPIEFPPLEPATEIRSRLEAGQLILSFHWTSAGLVGLLESRDRVATWPVRQAAGLPPEIKSLARGLGLFGSAATVPAGRLAEGDWRGSMERIERMLFENSKITLAEGIEELVVVPDGWLWYVPFELMPVASTRPAADETADGRLLRDACRIRYAPTRSLAVMRAERRSTGPVAVHVGRGGRGWKPADAEAVLADLAAAVGRVAPLDASGPVPMPVAASVCDTLLVLDEIAGDAAVASRPLLPPSAGRAGLTLADWVASPAKRPQRILLPGLQTAMAEGLEQPPVRAGEDVFLVATDLLAAGARTAVVSRWKTGGKSCADLMTEFLREAAAEEPVDAATAWQRAVDLVVAEEPDPAREPRIRQPPDAPLGVPLHPLLWAGNLLIDCGSGRAAAAAGPP